MKYFLLMVILSSFVYADSLIDSYDYTSGMSVNYTLEYVDSNLNGLYEYVNISTNETCVVSVNGDYGRVFYLESLNDTNILEIVVYSGGFVVYDESFYFDVNVSQFESVYDFELSYIEIDSDLNGLTDTLEFSSGIDCDSTYYFRDDILLGTNVNYTSMSELILLESVYVSCMNHLFDVNYSVFLDNFDRDDGIYFVDESYDDFTLNIDVGNVGCDNFSVLVSGLYDFDLEECGDFSFELDSNYLLENKVDGPYEIYINNHYYKTSSYSYMNFNSSLFKDVEVKESSSGGSSSSGGIAAILDKIDIPFIDDDKEDEFDVNDSVGSETNFSNSGFNVEAKQKYNDKITGHSVNTSIMTFERSIVIALTFVLVMSILLFTRRN